MTFEEPTLHILCGKIASGKSTLAAQLGARDGTVVMSEDVWLAGLFGDQMATGADFMRFSGKLRSTMAPHVVAMLNSGLSVVLDFAANTVEQRAWMRGLVEESGAHHRLHVLDTDEEVCLARLKVRNAGGTHPFDVSEELFRRFSRNFVLPGPEEGFEVMIHGATA